MIYSVYIFHTLFIRHLPIINARMGRGTKWTLKDFCSKCLPYRELTGLHAFATCLSDIRACVDIVSLKVIVGITGLNGENTRRTNQNLMSGLDGRYKHE